MNEWYTAAVPNPPPRCLTVRLLPYTLGHEILLERLTPAASSLPSDLRPLPSLRDRLILAVLICSQSYESALAAVRSPFLRPFLWLWRLRLGRHPDWSAAYDTFEQYRSAGSWMPESNRPIGGQPLVSPGPVRLLACLMRDLHLTSSQAFNTPLALANILYSALGEMEGKLSLFSKTDAAMLAAVKKMEATDKEQSDSPSVSSVPSVVNSPAA